MGFEAVWADDRPAAPPVEVAGWQRCPRGPAHQGEWRPPPGSAGGVLTLVWDNSYSRLRSKEVTFELSCP